MMPFKGCLLSLTIICCFVSTPAKCQQRFTDNLRIGANYHYGYVLPEYSYFTYIVNAPVQSFSVNISKPTLGKNEFERLYNYPEYGVSIFYSTLGNDDVFGRQVAIFPYYHLKVISRNRFTLFHELGMGLAYVTRKYDVEDNHTNIAVGSYFNIHFNLKLGVNYRIYKNVLINAGASFDHLSNANLQNPNLGINYATTFGGLSFMVGQEIQRQTPEFSPHKREFKFELIASVGAKRTRGVKESGWFNPVSLTFETKWSWLRALHLGVGADIFYDPSGQAEIEGQGRTDYTPSDDFSSGIHLSQEFIYRKISLILQEGLYVILPDNVNHEAMYNRGIIRVQVSKKMFIQLAMKSNLVVLDYPELGFGLKWK